MFENLIANVISLWNNSTATVKTRDVTTRLGNSTREVSTYTIKHQDIPVMIQEANYKTKQKFLHKVESEDMIYEMQIPKVWQGNTISVDYKEDIIELSTGQVFGIVNQSFLSRPEYIYLVLNLKNGA